MNTYWPDNFYVLGLATLVDNIYNDRRDGWGGFDLIQLNGLAD